MKLFIASLLLKSLVWVSPQTIELVKWDGCVNGRLAFKEYVYSYEARYTEFVCNQLYPAFDKVEK